MKKYTVSDLSLGEISDLVAIDEYTIREVSGTDEDGNRIADFLVQGHIRNGSSQSIDDVKFDVSYYDSDNCFLGLDKSGFLDEDELEPRGMMAFSINLNIPDGTEQLVLNVSAKKMATGWLMKWLYKG